MKTNKLDKKIKVGDLIIWKDGSVGIFVSKEELYARLKVASRNYKPRWRWFIQFNKETPWDYSKLAGVSEPALLAGTYGEVIFND